MSGYIPLFDITVSSLWSEDSDIRVVFITLMALADSRGIVEASLPGLARSANVSLEACQKAIELFLAPDKYSRSEEFEGRRIKKVDGGWLLLNHQKYREKAKSRAAYFKNWRDNKKNLQTTNPQTTNLQTTHSNGATDAQQVTCCATVAKPLTLFEEFWQEYPKKTNKAGARVVFNQINPSPELIGRMIGVIRKCKVSDGWRREAGRFIPKPENWLREGRWEDSMEDAKVENPVCLCGCGRVAEMVISGQRYYSYGCYDKTGSHKSKAATGMSNKFR